jgi:hypothetical protein
MEKAREMVEKFGSVNGGNTVNQGLHISMAHLLLASCYPTYENILYDSPPSDPPCFCETCAKMLPPATGCSCSDCNPEPTLPPLSRSNQQTQPAIPMNLRLTDAMVKHGTAQLEAFRQEIWDEKREELGFVLPVAILPDSHIKNLLDNFARLKSLEQLSPYIQSLHLLTGHDDRLFAILTELRHAFASMPQPVRKKSARVVPTANSDVGSLLMYRHF